MFFCIFLNINVQKYEIIQNKFNHFFFGFCGESHLELRNLDLLALILFVLNETLNEIVQWLQIIAINPVNNEINFA